MRRAHISLKNLFVITGISLQAGVAAGQSVPAPSATVILTSAPPYSATGELFILKADTNTVLLRNPVLVVEGFDIGNTMGWEVLYTLFNQENLVTDLQAFGRDLLVLNFTDSTIDIPDNAALTESAVRFINDNRADSNDKFTAVGASLGGLTLRKALLDLPEHDVDTWISFDAPHEGANIPLGLQEYLEFFAPHNDAAAELLSVLDRPASRQLLLTHHSHPDGAAGGSAPERMDFQAALDTMGYPTNCKTIAISNGSGFGDKFPFAPGEQIIHWTYTGGILDPDIEADVYALPQTSALVFSGEISLFVPIDSASVYADHPLSIDNAPGGGRSTFYQLYTNIPPDQISGDDFCAYTNHCFVPTVSALGIPIENLESNLAANADLLRMSPFDEIHFAPGNEAHVEINANNKRWIMRAILEGHDTDGDGFDDYEEFLMGTAYDSVENTFEVVQIIHANPPDPTVELSWNALPHVQYDIWFTDDLINAWSHIETIPPTAGSIILREYALDPESPDSFFLITADPVDPVSD